MIEIGKSLPNLTGPTLTIPAADVAALNGLVLFGATMPVASSCGSTHFRSFEYQGCAKSLIRRHDQPFSLAPHGQSILPM